MERIKKYFVPSFMLLTANVVYFIWLPYYKCIFPLIPSETIRYDIFTNFFFFFVYNICLIGIAKTYFGSRYKRFITYNDYILQFLFLLIARLAFDALKLVCYNLLPDGWLSLFHNFSELIMIILNFGILLFYYDKEMLKSKKFRKLLCIGLALSVFIIVIFACFNIKLNSTELYLRTPELVDAVALKSAFILQVRNMICETIFSIIIFICFVLSFEEKKEMSKRKNKRKLKTEVVVARVFAVLCISFILCQIKIFMLPQSFISNSNWDRFEINSSTKEFNMKTNVYTVKRISKNRNEQHIVYMSTTNIVRYGEKKLLSFTEAGDSGELPGDESENKSSYTDANIDGKSVRIYKDICAMYLDSGKPVAVMVDKDSKDPFMQKIVASLK